MSSEVDHVGLRAAIVGRYDLTEREVDVVIEVLRGSTDSECAEKLGLSRETVRGYTRKALHKMGLKRRTGLGLAVARALFRWFRRKGARDIEHELLQALQRRESSGGNDDA
jgi:DNA-binding CsgD family transcriptional regulator